MRGLIYKEFTVFCKCIDKKLIESIIGCQMHVGKDRNQRAECGCMESIDVGVYDTCPNGCVYCYANHKQESVAANSRIRVDFESAAREHGLALFIPPLRLCGDNGAMVGAQGYYEYLAGHTAGMELNAYATKEIEE